MSVTKRWDDAEAAVASALDVACRAVSALGVGDIDDWYRRRALEGLTLASDRVREGLDRRRLEALRLAVKEMATPEQKALQLRVDELVRLQESMRTHG